MNRSAMSPFSIFALLYMTPVLLAMVEAWEAPRFTLAVLVITAIIILTGITRVKFMCFLIFATAYFLIFRFPEVANHVNLMLYLNVVMLVAGVHSFVRNRDDATDNDYFEMIRPVLRASLILVYFLAGFDKLNTDFFKPAVSCAGGTLDDVLWTMRLNILGVPVALVLAAGVLFLVWKLIGGTRFAAPESRASIPLLVLCSVGVLCGALVIVVVPLDTLAALIPLVVLMTAVMVVLWEVVGGLLLTVPKLQVAILPFSLTMHGVLALVGFVDFGALAFSLLFAFIPHNYGQILSSQATLRFSGLVVHRAHVYFVINVVAGILLFSDLHTYRFLDITLVSVASGILFNLTVLLLIWPILSTMFSSSRRPVWGGVPVLNRRMPSYMFVFLVFLFLFGMTSHLGLRTAGNFSMFSNLRTEGSQTNHILLGSNPIKIWGYQEDVVRIIEIDDRYGRIIHHYESLRGYELPVVEFRKWIYEWTRAGYAVPLTFKYQGEVYSTKDIVKNPVWRTDERNWQMVLMDFRAIQPNGPNQCRW